MFAAAFAALLLVLVHPLCSVAYPGTTIPHASASTSDTGHTLPETCCSDAKDGALVKLAELFIASMVGDAPGPAPVSWIRLPVSSDAGVAASTQLAVSPERSYYARSARILR